ncbi:unnamed protein product [Paramecium sonneborni]|uniref:Cyclic nucleotide-binding domain-containing protein n=1 Tax=Paramecium sonneborni TaxID=65129 RepID=A0A8S1PH06_9CILI|nr:unnamed protein product [Paramecium sonneborni]
MPQSLQFPSDLKPPTINSSLLSNPNSFSDPNIHRQIDIFRPNQTDTPELKLIDETETKKMKKSNFNKFKMFVFSSPFINKEILDQKIIHKFITLLKQKAYIYNDYFFNSLQKQILTEKYIISPHDLNTNHQNLFILNFLFYIIWDLLTLIFTIILIFWLIYKITFHTQNQQLTQILFMLFIILDLFIYLISPYILKGNRIFNKFEILKHQIPCNLLINLIYSITTIVLLIQNNNDEIMLILYAFQFISSLLKLNSILNKLSDYTSLNFQLIINITQLLYLIHLSSCIWHILAINNDNSWIYQYQLHESDNITRYCHSFYYSISQLLNGSNNITLNTNTELIFSSILTFLSVWICSLIILKLNQNLKPFYEQQLQLFKDLETINAFLNKRNVPLLMKAKVRNYIKYMFYNKKNDYEIQTILQSLRPDMKEELIFQIRLQALSYSKILQKFSKDSLQQLTKYMERIHYNPNEIISQQDQSLYLIDSGEIEVQEYEQRLHILKLGDSFGETYFFSGILNKTIYKTLEFTQLYKIKQSDFINIILSNKVDHERFMYIKHSIQYGYFNIINLKCYSCDSQTHLINNCPILNYKPDIEKIFKHDNFHSQNRGQFLRDKNIDQRAFNRTFKRILINFDAMKMFRLKYDLIDPNDLYSKSNEIIESEDIESDSDSGESYEQYQSDQILSDNRFIDKQDGTIVSIIKQQDQLRDNSKILLEVDDNIEEMFIIRPNNQKTTLSTAQFQFEQQQQQQYQQQQQLQQQQQILQQQQQLNQQSYRFSLIPMDPKTRKQSSSQLEQASSQNIATEGQIPTVKGSKHNSQIAFKGEYSDKLKHGSQNKISSHINVDNKMKKNLSRIREEDSDTLNLSNRYNSDEQQSSQNLRYFYRQSNNSLPSRNTQLRPSMKRISSKISSINFITGTRTYNKTSNPFTRSFGNFPTTPGMVDLSMYKREDLKPEDFETMFLYKIYFPLGNYPNIINRLNYYLKWKLQDFVQSKYTFQFKVKQLTQKHSLLQMNLDLLNIKSQSKTILES